jgi:Nucleoside-diphosphate-sugar pyrophosphorylase involved in lipopolysaccharide biosynthesis/translation initiation factor 2B, gamma/epsilon subunits (eIF-2Bgamma/eIF-2Bepsilon)
MKAMILAAGMGTRLQPLTLTKPKALVEVKGIPMLEIVIKRLIKFGFTDIIINIHHFGDQIVDFLERNNNFGISITLSDERDLLLDTGGGLLKAKDFFADGKPFLVHNVDILTNLDLGQLFAAHTNSNSLATLAVKERKTSRSLLIGADQSLCGWKNHQSGKTIIAKGVEANLQPIAFSAVYVLNPSIFPLITENGVFSVMDVFLRLAASHSIQTFRHDQDFWIDLGRVENLKEAKQYISLL